MSFAVVDDGTVVLLAMLEGAWMVSSVPSSFSSSSAKKETFDLFKCEKQNYFVVSFILMLTFPPSLALLIRIPCSFGCRLPCTGSMSSTCSCGIISLSASRTLPSSVGTIAFPGRPKSEFERQTETPTEHKRYFSQFTTRCISWNFN